MLKHPLNQYANRVFAKFSTTTQGSPEDQLRAPIEALFIAAGQALNLKVVPVGETQLDNSGGRPDFGITVNGALAGYVELKAPGKGANTAIFKGRHDKTQWRKFQDLPNLIYCDGREFGLYRWGERQQLIRFEGAPDLNGANAITESDIAKFETLIRDFLMWQPIVPNSATQLASYLAPLTRILRDDVLNALNNGIEDVISVANDWRRYLFPGLSNARFADDYAQTVTFSLLLARSDGAQTLNMSSIVESLDHANPLLASALQILTYQLVQKHLATSLNLLQRVINEVPTGTMSGGRKDPWLHFYEDFLVAYDAKLR